MTQETSPAPDWYEDPEFAGQLRYWDGQAWTEHRAEPGNSAEAQATPAKPAKAPKEPSEPKEGAERSFPLVVAAVLAAALALIVFIAVVVIWFDSYNSGQARGERAKESGISPASVSEYCEELASDFSTTGSADGYWDYPWIWGCKRGLG